MPAITLTFVEFFRTYSRGTSADWWRRINNHRGVNGDADRWVGLNRWDVRDRRNAYKTAGKTLGVLLATAKAALDAKARGDYATYNAKADVVAALINGCVLRRLPQTKWPTWSNEWVRHAENKKQVPWARQLAAIPGHYVRVSHDDDTQVAYYRSGAKLLEGKQVRVSPGKYLAEFFPTLHATEVKKWAGYFANASVDALYYVENDDPDGWVAAYEYAVSASGGGCSCMRGKDCVRVYALAGNGLRLATLWSGEPFASTLIARCIVRTDTTPPQYVRPYTLVGGTLSPENFGALLQSAGYAHGSLNGVRVRRIRGGSGFVMPYIDSGYDGDQEASDEGGYLLLGDGSLCCSNTNGYTDCGELCYHCEGNYDLDDLTAIDGEYYCSDCSHRLFTRAITSWNNWSRCRNTEYHANDSVTYDDSTGEYVADDITDERGEFCYQCGEYHSDDDELTAGLNKDGDEASYCANCCDDGLEKLDILPANGSDVEYAHPHLTCVVRGSDSALTEDCVEVDGEYYLSPDHPDYDEEQDAPPSDEDEVSTDDTPASTEVAHTPIFAVNTAAVDTTYQPAA